MTNQLQPLDGDQESIFREEITFIPETHIMVLPHAGITVRVMRAAAFSGFQDHGISKWRLVLACRPAIVIGSITCDPKWDMPRMTD